MDYPAKEQALAEGYRQARRITKQYAKTFYLAGCFLPREKRDAAFSVYAIGRLGDEAVDGIHASPKDKLIAQVKDKVAAAYAASNDSLNEPLLLVFRETVKKFHIPKHYLDELFAGISMDLEKTRYRNFQELYTYCYRVAGVVGLLMLKIFGEVKPQAQKYAIDLGIAMQLTNILRDIPEDWGRGRIYLPQEEMVRYRITESDIANKTVSSDFKALLQFQIQRAREYYASAKEGIKNIQHGRSRFVVSVMLQMYSEILTVIERQGYDIYSKRAYVPAFRKVSIIACAMAHGGSF